MLFNRESIDRKLDRMRRNALNRRRYDSYAANHRLDFSLDSKKKNPYTRNRTNLPIVQKIWIIIGIIAAVGSILTIFYHPFFRFQKSTISVSGIRRIDKEEFISAVASIAGHRRFIIFPGNSYVFLDTGELRDILMKRYTLASVEIKKIFPHFIDIHLEEILSTIIYDNGGRFAYVGADGRVIKILRPIVDEVWSGTASSTLGSSTQIEYIPNASRLNELFGDYPIVYDTREKEKDELSQNGAVLSKKTTDEIILLYKLLENRTNIPIKYIRIQDDITGDAIIRTGEGWEIKVRLADDIQGQFDRLTLVLRDQKNRAALKYIDVRYRERVFWQ